MEIAEADKLALDRQAGSLERLAISRHAIMHGRDVERSGDVADPPVAEIDQIGDGVEHRALVVENDGVGIDAFANAVEQHHRHVGVVDNSLQDCAVADARDDQSVDHPVEQQPDLVVLRVQVLVRAAQHDRIAGAVECLLDDRNDIGEERIGDVGNGKPDGAGRAHLQAAGDRVALVADVADRLFDALAELGTGAPSSTRTSWQRPPSIRKSS